MTTQEKTVPVPPAAPSKPDPIVFLEEDEDFDALYEESLKGFHEEDIVSGTVTEITRDYVTVDIGFKSDCLITINEFQNAEGVLQVELGDSVEVYVEALEADEDGVTYLSKRKTVPGKIDTSQFFNTIILTFRKKIRRIIDSIDLQFFM